MPFTEIGFSGVLLILYAVEYLFALAGLMAISATAHKKGEEAVWGTVNLRNAWKPGAKITAAILGPVFFAFLILVLFSGPSAPGFGHDNEEFFLFSCALFSGFCALIFRWITRGRVDRKTTWFLLSMLVALPVVMPALYYSRVEILTARNARELIRVPLPPEWGGGVSYDVFKVLDFDGDEATAYAKICRPEWQSILIDCRGEMFFYKRIGNGWENRRQSEVWDGRDDDVMVFPPL